MKEFFVALNKVCSTFRFLKEDFSNFHFCSVLVQCKQPCCSIQVFDNLDLILKQTNGIFWKLNVLFASHVQKIH